MFQVRPISPYSIASQSVIIGQSVMFYTMNFSSCHLADAIELLRAGLTNTNTHLCHCPLNNSTHDACCITSNVYAMYILSNHYLCVYLFLLLLLLFLVCFTVYLSAAFIEWFYVYVAVMSVLTRENFSIHC